MFSDLFYKNFKLQENFCFKCLQNAFLIRFNATYYMAIFLSNKYDFNFKDLKKFKMKGYHYLYYTCYL